MSKPRVFVSSVVDGYEEYRAAAREAIREAGAEPVLVNEDFPSLATSSRNACLDAVDSCDIYLIMIGGRGGWVAPSGKLVVEEEYDRARRNGIPVLAFLQSVERDDPASRLASVVSDYVSGMYRRTFQAKEDLRTEIERALRPALSLLQRPIVSDEQLSGIFATPYQVRDETTLRFAFAPERREEVIDPVRLDSSDLLDKLYELAHAPTVRLFSYKQSKMSELQGDSLVIVQSNSEYSHQETQETRLELAESGQLIVDTNVTGRTARQDRFDMSRMFLVAGDDIEAALRPAFAFAAALFNEIDPYERHQRFLYDTALTGIGQRRFTDTVPHSQNVYSMSLSGSDEPARAFETPRLVTRADLDTPDNEIKRILTMLARRMNSKSR